jgi:hypothetical protein
MKGGFSSMIKDKDSFTRCPFDGHPGVHGARAGNGIDVEMPSGGGGEP